jgi:hypothetical protein
MQALYQGALDYLSALTFHPDAEKRVCWLPLSGIYWQDEIPDLMMLTKVEERSRNQIYRLFAIRFKIWADERLTDEDQEFWDSARWDVPSCPIFQRLNPSEEDMRENHAVQSQVEEEFAHLIEDADEATIIEGPDGLQEFSLTFKLNDETAGSRKPGIWERLLNRLRI